LNAHGKQAENIVCKTPNTYRKYRHSYAQFFNRIARGEIPITKVIQNLVTAPIKKEQQFHSKRTDLHCSINNALLKKQEEQPLKKTLLSHAWSQKHSLIIWDSLPSIAVKTKVFKKIFCIC